MQVLRQAKHEVRKNARLDDNVALSMEKMATNSAFSDVKFIIGNIPFYAQYVTANQLILYNRLCNSSAVTVAIDATGSICDKMAQNKQIFLYQVVVPKHENVPQLPVSQMLSSQHDALSIKQWLERWQFLGPKEPQIVVCDASKALLNAIVGAFTNFPTLADYIDDLFTSIQNETKVTFLLHLDICHFVKNVSNWTCYREKGIKKFFVHAICLIVRCKTLKSAGNVYKAIVVIACSRFEGEMCEKIHLSQSKKDSCWKASKTVKMKHKQCFLRQKSFQKRISMT